MKAIPFLVAMLVASTTACVEPEPVDYSYAPQPANAQAAGVPAERIGIPQEAPRGSIEITSYGMTALQGNVPALHVREIVRNDSDDAPWTLDSTKQLIEIPGEGQSRAAYAESDVHTLPQVTINRGERHVVDFYYPLPANIDGANGLPAFQVLWDVQTPARDVTAHASFDRVESPSVPAAAYDTADVYYAGYAPYWWYDPLYSSFVFWGHPRPFYGWGYGYGYGHGYGRGYGARGYYGHPVGRMSVGHFGGGYHAHFGGGGHGGGFHGGGFHGGGGHGGHR
jgi:hypothetical protein